MFDWLRKRRESVGNPSNQPESPGQVPAEIRQCLAAMQPYLEHPFVRDHFHQVTWLSLAVPGRGPEDLYTLEFRAGSRASLIWMDGPDRWCIGKYVPLAHPDADIACAPSGLTPSYWRECAVVASLEQAIAFLETATPAIFRGVKAKPG